MDIAEHIAVIEEEGHHFAVAANQGGLDAVVTTCPGWDLRELVRHLSEIHLWAAAHVARRARKMWIDDLEELTVSWPELAWFWPDDEELVAHYLATNGNLVRELRDAPADVEAMTFLPAPSPLAMWARRQAHELTIHRFDAQHAAGAVEGIDAGLAADGIDELLMCFAPRARRFPCTDDQTMVVHAADTGHHWRVAMHPDGIETTREDGPADVVLTGLAEDLYLSVWNRGDRASLDVVGDRAILAAWHDHQHVRWS